MGLPASPANACKECRQCSSLGSPTSGQAQRACKFSGVLHIRKDTETSPDLFKKLSAPRTGSGQSYENSLHRTAHSWEAGQESLTSLDSISVRETATPKQTKTDRPVVSPLIQHPVYDYRVGVLCRPLRVLARMEGSGAVQTMMLCCPLAIDECNVPAEPMQQYTGALNVMCSGNVFPCTLHYAAVNQR